MASTDNIGEKSCYIEIGIQQPDGTYTMCNILPPKDLLSWFFQALVMAVSQHLQCCDVVAALFLLIDDIVEHGFGRSVMALLSLISDSLQVLFWIH